MVVGCTEYVCREGSPVLTTDWAPFVEIGVALTVFGGLFMLLGVMLFFDGALLALGNVRSS